MRILISGAGLAGLSTAYWLHCHGHEPVVIERAPDLRRDGYGLDFFGTGYDVAQRMGIVETLAQRQIFLDKEGGIAFVDEDGKAKAELKIDAVRRVLDGKYMALMHGTLEEVLYDSVKNNVEVRFGASVAAVAQTPESVTVTFENELEETFDLLVGADGIHSNVRRLVFGPEEAFADYMGYYLTAYFVPNANQLEALWENYTEPGRQAGVYATDREEQLAALFLWQAEDEGSIAPEKRGAKLRAVFEGMGWIVPELLTEMPSDGNEILTDTVTQIRMDTWRSDRVVLVGDAAGCLTLISGQGASMALGGAYVLAEELGRTQDWRQALANYEHRVKPQIDLRQHKARDFAKRLVPGSELGVKAQTVLMKLVTYHAFSGLLKSQFMGDSFLQTAALHRLPRSSGNIVGYNVVGKLRKTDYQTLEMSLDEILKTSDSLGLLLSIDELKGVEAGALWEDWRFGRRYHEKIRKLAVVGDRRLSKWLPRLSEPLYAKDARHFAETDKEQAWEWLGE